MPKAKYKKDEKSKLYYTYIETGELYDNGKPKYKKIRGKTIDAVDEKINEYKKNQLLNIKPTNLTVGQWYETWISTYKSGCKETTQQWYARLYRVHVEPTLANIKLNAVKEAHCQKVLSDMANASAKTQKDVKYIMTSLFATAARNHLLYDNPAKDIKIKSKKQKKRRRSLTDDERKAYLASCKEHEFGVFAAFLYYLGLRRGECLAITANDIKSDVIVINKQYVYPDNNQAQLSTPKTSAGNREIPIPLGLRPFIARVAKKKGLIFSDDEGRPLSHKVLMKRWKSFIASSLGKESEITMHYIRHNYCTMLFEQGVDLQTAQYLMGHDDIETTMNVYAHYTKTIKKNNITAILNIGQSPEEAAETIA